MPVLCFFALRRHKKVARVAGAARRAQARYEPALVAAMRNPVAVLVARARRSLVAGVELAPRLGTEFLPELNEGALYVTFTLPRNISLDRGPQAHAEDQAR